MSIVKMKKLSLLAVRSQKDALLSDLMHLGCVEVSEPVPLTEDSDLYALIKKESSELDSFRSEQARLVRGLELLGHYAPEKTKMFELRPEITAESLLDESALSDVLELAKKLEQLDGQIKRLSALETQHKSLLEALEPWRPLTLPFDCTETEQTAVVLGTFPIITKLEDAECAVSAAVQEAQLLRVCSFKEQHYVVLVCLKTKLAEATEALRAFNFSVSQLKNLEGTAGENIVRIQAHLDEMAEEKQSLTAAFALEASTKKELRLCIDLINLKIAKAEAVERLRGTERVVAMTGWITVPEEQKLLAVLAKYNCAWELVEPAPEEIEQVPICLKNNSLTAPLMMVTEMYSLPRYDGIDPNPLITPFFTIFFGIMYADIGYGLILLVLGLLGAKLLKPRGMLKHATGLLTLCGITTIVFGVLFGSCFGDAVPVFTNLIGIGRIDLWNKIDPLKEPMTMLILSLVIGVVHILAGMTVNAYMLIRRGKWLDALFDVGSWWLVFAGIALGALGITWLVALAGAAALVLTQGRAKKSIPGKIIGGIASLYDITGYLGDVLSYTRIMALLLASSVIGSVVNVLGSLSGSVIVFIIVFLVGHAFNMGINIIGTFVHSARLQYLEFFGKFYKDGGRSFAPLKIKARYFDIIKEEK